MPRSRASAQELLPLEGITGDVVSLRDGGSCAVLEVSGVHFALRSEAEQEAILAAYRRVLNGLSHPVQLIVRVVPADIERYLVALSDASPRPELRPLLLDHQAFVRRVASERALLERRFFVIVPDEADTGSGRRVRRLPWRRPHRPTGQQGRPEAARRLRFRCEELAQGFGAFGVSARRLAYDDLLALWRDCLGTQPVGAALGGRESDE